MQTILTRGRVYNYSHCVGNNATSGTGFHYPNGIARGEGDLVYVCNQPDELQPVPHISKVSVGKTWHEEEHIQDIGGLGTEDGNFIWPSSITLDDKGCLYVTDEWLNRISVFDSEGKFLYKWGVSGSQEGELLGPTGIAINSEGHVFVTENLNHRVSVFDKQGSFLNTWGSLGTEHGKFNHPWGITIDNNDQVYIADWRNDRVEQYSGLGKNSPYEGWAFPVSIAPDCFSLETIVASYLGTKSWSFFSPAVVGIPLVKKISFTEYGIPWRGPL